MNWNAILHARKSIPRSLKDLSSRLTWGSLLQAKVTVRYEYEIQGRKYYYQRLKVTLTGYMHWRSRIAVISLLRAPWTKKYIYGIQRQDHAFRSFTRRDLSLTLSYSLDRMYIETDSGERELEEMPADGAALSMMPRNK